MKRRRERLEIFNRATREEKHEVAGEQEHRRRARAARGRGEELDMVRGGGVVVRGGGGDVIFMDSSAQKENDTEKT